MSRTRALLVGALASITLLTARADVKADFQFSTTGAGSTPFGAHSFLTLSSQPLSQILNGANLVNVQNVQITSTASPSATDSGLINFGFTLNLTSLNGPVQPATAGTGSTLVSGTLQISRSDTGGELSSLVSLTAAPVTIGNTTYTFSNPQYAGPVVNSLPNAVGAGNFSLIITPTTVPEPAALALIGTGVVLVALGLGRDRDRPGPA